MNQVTDCKDWLPQLEVDAGAVAKAISIEYSTVGRDIICAEMATPHHCLRTSVDVTVHENSNR